MDKYIIQFSKVIVPKLTYHCSDKERTYLVVSHMYDKGMMSIVLEVTINYIGLILTKVRSVLLAAVPYICHYYEDSSVEYVAAHFFSIK